MKLGICGAIIGALVAFTSAPALALVNYDKGQRVINGIVLLQDAADETLYYYVPQFPRLASNPDGSLELVCLKYADQQNGTTGGLLHALVEFALPPEAVADLEKQLKKEVPNARIAGPVPL